MSTGARLKHARIYAGLSQEQLAELAGVSQTLVSMVERGRPATTEHIERVARATGFSTAFLSRPDPLPDLPEGSLRYRKRAATTQRDDERFRGHVRHTMEFVAELRQGLRLPPVRIAPVDAHEVTGDDIEPIADATREALDIGPLDPVSNTVRAAERAGILVIGSSEDLEGHNGASYWPDFPDGQPIICFTRGMPGDRQRFTIAHEIGHLRLHKLRQQLGSRDAEIEANRFAGALLLPAAAARHELVKPNLQDLVRAKGRWGISVRALVKRCLDLGIITPERRLSLEKQIAARGWSKTEPGVVHEERPLMLEQMIAAKLGKPKTTEIAARAGLPPMAIRDMVS